MILHGVRPIAKQVCVDAMHELRLYQPSQLLPKQLHLVYIEYIRFSGKKHKLFTLTCLSKKDTATLYLFYASFINRINKQIDW